MKVSNADAPGARALRATRGMSATNVTGAKGVTLRDPATETIGQAWDITLGAGLGLTDNEDGTANIFVTGSAGGGTPTPVVNTPIVAALSNPPTQPELEDAIGSVPGAVTGQWYVVTDSDTGRGYAVVSNGTAFLFVPLVSPSEDLSLLVSAAGSFNGAQSQNSSVIYDATSNTTFLFFMNVTGEICAASFDHATGVGSAVTVVDTPTIDVDVHGTPTAVMRASDRKFVVWYSGHNNVGLYQRISTNAADVTAWGGETNLDAQLGGSQYTYPQGIELNDGIYLFYRRDVGVLGIGLQWAYSKTVDGGTTWAAETLLTKEPSHWSYLSPHKTADDRIDILYSDRSTFDETGGSIYHFYIQDGSYYETDATEIPSASLPFEAADMTQVWASNGTQRADPFGSVVMGSDGNPRVSFHEFETISPEDARYWWAAWNGSGWWSTEVTSAGSGSYVATAVLEPGNPSALWLTKDDGSGIAQVRRYYTLNGGASWTSQTLTATATDNAMLIPVVNAPPELKVVWQLLPGGTFARNDFMAASFYGAGVVVTEGADLQRVVAIDEATGALVEITFRVGSSGALEVSDDGGTTYEGAGGAAHVHIVGEPYVGDGAQTVYYLAQDAELDTVAAYTAAGARVAITQDTTELDKITFTAAPAAGTGFIDYVPTTT